MLLKGLGAAPGTGSGTVRIVRTLEDAERLRRGRDPGHPHDRARLGAADAPKSAAIVTDSGGMTCHAAIVSRELGHPLRGRDRGRDRQAARRRAGHGRRDPRLVHEGAMTAAEEHAAAGPAAAATAAAPPITGTKLLVNLSEPSQARAGRRAAGRRRRPAARRADGARGARGQAPPPAARGGPRRRVRPSAWATALSKFAEALRPAADHLPHDRLPHQRVPRARGRRQVRARGGQPDDRVPRRAPLHPRARPVQARARRDPPASGTRGTPTST